MSTAEDPISLFGNLIRHDFRPKTPTGFVFVGDLPDDKVIDMQIGLLGRDTPGLVKRLYETCTPGSPSYGEYLSKEEAESYARPTDEVVRKINAWLSYYGIQFKYISPSGNRLQITLPVSKANKIFKATFSTYRHTETGTQSYQALSYSLPSHLSNIIESVEPTTSFPHPISRPTVQSFIDGSSLNSVGITPKDLMGLYGIPTAKAGTQTRTLLSVAGFLSQYANREDLALFLGTHRLDLVKATFTDQSIDGGQNIQTPGSAGEEANLDIQYSVGLVNFAPVEFISCGLSTINGWINLADHWLAQDNPPTVVSISYGFNEHVLSKDSTNTLSNRYAQLGARGVSILVSTGDGGVAGSQPPSGDPPYKFIPTFPASCPYVTAVGATTGDPEVAASLSAGGFSNYFTRDLAPYQKEAVDGYLDKIGPLYEDRFDRNGRAFPDISAQGGTNILMVLHQNHKFSGGTSVATPTCASVITLLNNRLIQQKRNCLGFLNPLLYANPTVLNDITEGSNPGSGTDGFPAKPGWDPVTGLGTPNFPKMAEAIGV